MLNPLISLLSQKLLAKKFKLATAESCTGGLLAARLTALPGSSHWFDRSYVCYSNQAKHEMLQINENIFTHDGAVSARCVGALVEGLLKIPTIDAGVSISGIAGPDGGSFEKPVGTVWFGFGVKQEPIQTILKNFSGSREHIREQACIFAIEHLTTMLE